MPKINVKIGERNLIINCEEGVDGFIEINDADSDTSLHIRDEGEMLIALHFVEGEEDPVSQIDVLTGEIH